MAQSSSATPSPSSSNKTNRNTNVDTCLTADPGIASLIPTRSHTFVEIDHEIISPAILLHSADSRRVAVS